LTILDLHWQGNDQARYQADVLKFLRENPEAVLKEWASIVLHIADETARSEHYIPIAVKGDAARTAAVVAGAIVRELKTQPGQPTFSGITVRFYDIPPAAA
jgi:hypothetical protein